MDLLGFTSSLRGKLMPVLSLFLFATVFFCHSYAYSQSEEASQSGAGAATQVNPATVIQERIHVYLHLIEQGKAEHFSDQRMGYLWATLASDYRRAGDFSQSEAAYMQAIELLKRHEDSSRNYATVLDNLGMLYLTYARLEEAERYVRQSAAIRREKGYRLDLARSDVHMAEIDLALHRFKQVEEEASRALAVMEEMHDPEPKGVISALNALTYARCMRKRCEEGMAAAQRSLELSRASFGAESVPSADAMMSVGFALWKLGRMDDADRTMRSAVEMMRRQAGPQNRLLLLLLAVYRDYLKDVHREGEADEITQEITQVRSREPLCGGCVTVNSLRGSAR